MLAVDTQKWLPWKEPVTVTSVRPNSADVVVPLTNAGVYRVSLREAANSNGVYQSGDIKVTVATDGVAFTPKPRDTVLWGGDLYTVLEVAGSAWTKHWVLHARNLVIAADLRQMGTLARPSNAQDAAGRPTLASYTTVSANIPCRVQPEGGTAADVGERRTIPKRFVAILLTQVDARAKDTFTCDGVTYTVLEARNPERIDQLPSLLLEKVL